MYLFRNSHFGENPKKLKSLFSRNKQRSKDIKHLTTASEIKSCQGHLVQKHKPQEMITQYACNKPAFMTSKYKT